MHWSNMPVQHLQNYFNAHQPPGPGDVVQNVAGSTLAVAGGLFAAFNPSWAQAAAGLMMSAAGLMTASFPIIKLLVERSADRAVERERRHELLNKVNQAMLRLEELDVARDELKASLNIADSERAALKELAQRQHDEMVRIKDAVMFVYPDEERRRR